MTAGDDAVEMAREIEDVVRKHGFQVQSHKRDWTTMRLGVWTPERDGTLDVRDQVVVEVHAWRDRKGVPP